MKLLHKFSLICILAYPTLSVASPLSITEKEINHYLSTRLAEKVPLQDQVGVPGLFQLDYKLSDLHTLIGQTAERVDIAGTVDGLLRLKGKSYQAKMRLNMDTVPFYDAEKGALFLKNVRLKNWSIEPEKYQKELQMFLPMIADGLASILNNTPVYTLDEKESKEALVKKFGKAIVVEKGKLRLETKLF